MTRYFLIIIFVLFRASSFAQDPADILNNLEQRLNLSKSYKCKYNSVVKSDRFGQNIEDRILYKKEKQVLDFMTVIKVKDQLLNRRVMSNGQRLTLIEKKPEISGHKFTRRDNIEIDKDLIPRVNNYLLFCGPSLLKIIPEMEVYKGNISQTDIRILKYRENDEQEDLLILEYEFVIKSVFKGEFICKLYLNKETNIPAKRELYNSQEKISVTENYTDFTIDKDPKYKFNAQVQFRVG